MIRTRSGKVTYELYLAGPTSAFGFRLRSTMWPSKAPMLYLFLPWTFRCRPQSRKHYYCSSYFLGVRFTSLATSLVPWVFPASLALPPPLVPPTLHEAIFWYNTTLGTIDWFFIRWSVTPSSAMREVLRLLCRGENWPCKPVPSGSMIIFSDVVEFSSCLLSESRRTQGRCSLFPHVSALYSGPWYPMNGQIWRFLLMRQWGHTSKGSVKVGLTLWIRIR